MTKSVLLLCYVASKLSALAVTDANAGVESESDRQCIVTAIQRLAARDKNTVWRLSILAFLPVLYIITIPSTPQQQIFDSVMWLVLSNHEG
jgi:hypothetical protein